MEQLIIKWKHWYWYLVLLFNISIPALIAVDRMTNKNGNGSPVMLCVAPTLIFPLLLIYMYYTMKEFKACREIIKDDRFGFFWKGIVASFISFNLFIITLVVSWKATSAGAGVGYTALAFTCILGVASGAFLSWYEFCVNWDIFYNKNKETIIASYLNKKTGGSI